MPELRPYQAEDVLFLSRLCSSGCFNEQRTGKTPTALMTIKEKGLENERILIVTTVSASYQWKEEYERWLGQPCAVCTGTYEQKKRIIENWEKGLIISFGSLKTTRAKAGFESLILLKKPAMIIVDEAHHMRNPRTFMAKSLFKLSKIPNKMCLTGTPIYGEPKDIYSILHFLWPKEFTSAYKFYDEYLQPEFIYLRTGGELRKITKYSNFLPGKEVELQKRLAESCTQRKRKDIMQWLPEKDRETVRLNLTKEQTKYLNELSETFETEDVITQGVLDRLIRYRQICLDPGLIGLKGTSPKTEWVCNFIEENPDTPVIIFSNFTQYLIRLYDTLKEKNYKLAMIVGNVSPERRDKFKNDFQAGKFNIFLINTASGQEGLTLDRAEAIIFTDAYPPVGSIEQAEDRFIATTEEKANKPHAIYYLVMKNSYDETIKHALEKRKTEAEVINDFKAQLERSQNGKS